MSASTFRIVIAIFLGIFLYWFVKGQIKLIEYAGAQSSSTIDIDSDVLEQPKGELPEQLGSIGFKYNSDADTDSKS